MSPMKTTNKPPPAPPVMYSVMTTDELIRYCRENPYEEVETRLSLAGGLAYSSHTLFWKGALYDSLADRRFERIGEKAFRELYNNASWRVRLVKQELPEWVKT